MWNYFGNKVGEAPGSLPLLWIYEGRSTWICVPGLHGILLVRDWEFGVCLRVLPSSLAVAQNLMSSLLLTPSGHPFLQYFATHETKTSKCFMICVDPGRNGLLLTCLHAPCVPYHLGFCTALLLLIISQDFSGVFLPHAMTFFCIWQSCFTPKWFHFSPLPKDTEACT